MAVLEPGSPLAASDVLLKGRVPVCKLQPSDVRSMVVRIFLTSPEQLPKRFAHTGDVICISKFIRLRHGFPSQSLVALSKTAGPPDV